MRKLITSTLPFFGIGAIAIAILIAFSFTNTYFAQFATQQKPNQAFQGDLSTQSQLPLDADTLLGSNLMKIATGVFTDSMLAQNPNGPKTLASGTMTLSVNATSTALNMYGAAMAQAQKEIPSYSITDIKTVSDTQQNLNAFAQAFVAATNQNMVPFKGKDVLTLAYQAQQNNDADARKTLIAYVDATQHMIDATKAIAIPQSWAQTMVQYLNLVSQIRYTALALLVQNSDPLRANIMTNNYPNLIAQASQIGSTIKAGMQKLGYAI